MSVSTTMLRYECGSTFTLPVQCALLHPRSCCAIVVITCKALVYTGVDSDVRVNDDAEVWTWEHLYLTCVLLRPRSCCAIVVITCKALVYTGVDGDVRLNDNAEVSRLHEQRSNRPHCVIDSNATAALPNDWLYTTHYWLTGTFCSVVHSSLYRYPTSTLWTYPTRTLWT